SAASASVLFGNLDAHQSKLKELFDQAVIEDALFIHFLNQRPNLFFGKLANVVAEEVLVVGKGGQGRCGCGLQESFRHRDTVTYAAQQNSSIVETELTVTGAPNQFKPIRLQDALDLVAGVYGPGTGGIEPGVGAPVFQG